jgi:hypothetical protein
LALSACGERRGDRADDTRLAEGQELIESDRPAESDRAAVPPRPVQIGFDGPRFDACPGYGLVTNLPDGGAALPVRSAPTRMAEQIDGLDEGQGVSMCQQVGDWIGVVYAPAGSENMRCGTGSPVSSVREYEGPCNSGWVDENFIKLVAG